PGDPPYVPPPKFPTSTIDVAVVVPERTPSSEVAEALRGSAKETVRSVRLFDVYAGAGIPAGSRSLAFTVEFGAEDGTLSPKALEALQKRAIQSLERRGLRSPLRFVGFPWRLATRASPSSRVPLGRATRARAGPSLRSPRTPSVVRFARRTSDGGTGTTDAGRSRPPRWPARKRCSR